MQCVARADPFKITIIEQVLNKAESCFESLSTTGFYQSFQTALRSFLRQAQGWL